MRGRTLQLAQGEVGVSHNRGKGLIHLMGDGGGEFSHRDHAGYAGEILLCLTQLLFGSLLLGHVDTRANKTGKRPVRIESWNPNVGNPSKFAVVAPEAILHPKCLSMIKRLCVGIEASREILRIDSLRPAVAKFLVKRSTSEVQPGLVEV